MKPAPPIRAKTATAPTPTSPSEDILEQHIQRLEEQFGKLREQVRQSQQLASLGTAAAMMAHEYNNLMTPVVSYARYALDTDDHELMVKALNMTLKQGAIVSSMAERILGLAVHEAASYKPVALKTVVDESIASMCRDPAKDGITLKTSVDGDLQVKADQKQLIQVLFNLLLNAREAVDHGNGRIVLDAVARGDDWVDLRIKDNGCGIPDAHRQTIFEPFFTTKRKGPDGGRNGSGLGLAICQEIVEEHGGEIDVESEPGKGTTFIVSLPAAN